MPREFKCALKILRDKKYTLWRSTVVTNSKQVNDNLGGYPLIFGRSWLATTNWYIGCRLGDMTISHGNSTKNITLYFMTKIYPNLENPP